MAAHVPPVEEQARLIRWRADRIAEQTGAEWVHCRTEAEGDLEGGRPQLGELLEELCPDDHLVLWGVCRLGASSREVIGLLDRLAGLVHLHVLDFGGFSLDVSVRSGRAYIQLLNGAATVFRRQWSEKSIRSNQRRRAAGLAMGVSPGFGKRRIRTRAGKFDVWDAKQCAIIREIKSRKDTGETFTSIAEDFARRRLKRATGASWAKFARIAGEEVVRSSYVTKAYYWYEDLLARGEELGA